jgi:hypothetical protein
VCSGSYEVAELGDVFERWWRNVGMELREMYDIEIFIPIEQLLSFKIPLLTNLVG